eukprot:3760899-Pleurochrysis_carterae.AAC.5
MRRQKLRPRRAAPPRRERAPKSTSYGGTLRRPPCPSRSSAACCARLARSAVRTRQHKCTRRRLRSREVPRAAARGERDRERGVFLAVL